MLIRILKTMKHHREVRQLRAEIERLEEMEANADATLTAQRRYVQDLQAKVLGHRARHGMTSREIAQGVECATKRAGVLA